MTIMRYSLQRIVSWRSLNDARGDSRVISNEIIACALNRRHEKCHRHLACAVYRRKLAKVAYAMIIIGVIKLLTNSLLSILLKAL